MDVIYEPKGAAREYAPLALNIYNGCTHGCRYCYAPGALRIPRQEYFADANPKQDVVERVRKDARKLADAGDNREILLSFIGDPYQPAERELGLTRRAIEILIEHGLNFAILTKGAALARRDFDLLQDYDKARFGVSMSLHKPRSSVDWEPNADGAFDRLMALIVAHDFGIRTWLSVEPVIDPQQALDVIEATSLIVDHYKIGKLNHMSAHDADVDWIQFREAAVEFLQEWGCEYYIKRSLTEL